MSHAEIEPGRDHRAHERRARRLGGAALQLTEGVARPRVEGDRIEQDHRLDAAIEREELRDAAAVGVPDHCEPLDAQLI